ncbi:MAG: hypothetical protein ACJ8FP_08755, partial [Xanthobacteraceae bacterium]
GVTNGILKLDISQCSGFTGGLQGAMSNRGVLLSPATKQGEFTISGKVPVPGNVEVRRMPGLQYASPRYPYTPPEPHPAGSEYRRA